MKISPIAILVPIAGLGFSSCDGPQNKAPAPLSTVDEALRKVDVPVLPVKPGDAWIYQVRLVIPADASSPGSAEVDTSYQGVRTYLGKTSAAKGLPETDCFEVVVPGSPNEREFVEIHDDRILMRGSLILRPETTKPMWLATPVPFVIAGMKPGTFLPEFRTTDGALSRRTEVIAREDVTVPAGTFPCVRLLTTGSDGELELRSTVWFAFGKGIIRKEKTRYRGDKVIFRETQELTKVTKAP